MEPNMKIFDRMKRFRCFIYVFVLAFFPFVVNAQVRTVSEQEAIINLRENYLMSDEQIAKFKQLKEDRQQKIAEINRTVMTFERRNKQINLVKEQFLRELQSILSKEQYEAWIIDSKTINAIKVQVEKIFNEFWYYKMKSGKNLDNDNLDLRPEYEAKIVELMGVEGKKKFNKMLVYKMSKMEVVRNLNLPQDIAIKFCQQKLNFMDTCREIRFADLPISEHRSQIEKQRYRYENKIKKLVGAEKFAKWKQYQSKSFDRKATKVYKFSKQQSVEYKEIQTQLALKIHKIKRSNNTLDEKNVLIEAANTEMEQAVREILSAEQFDKWINDRRHNQSKRRK